MNKYNNSLVYKIERLNGDEANLVYVGSTTKTLEERYKEHVYALKYNSEKYIMTSKIIFNMYGVENCKITLLEKVNANSKKELEDIEYNWMLKLNCVNKRLKRNKTKNETKALLPFSNLRTYLKKPLSEAKLQCIEKMRNALNAKRELRLKDRDLNINAKERARQYRKEHYQKNKEKEKEQNKKDYYKKEGIKKLSDLIRQKYLIFLSIKNI